MNLVDVLRARRRIAPYVRRTPLVRSLVVVRPVRRRCPAEARVAAARQLVQVARRVQRGHRAARAVGTRRRGSSPPRPGITDARSRPPPKRSACRWSCSRRQTRRRPSSTRSGATARAPRGSSRLRRGRAAGEGVCGEDRRGVHLAVQRRGRHRRRGHRRARDLRGRRGRRPPDRADRRRRA